MSDIPYRKHFIRQTLSAIRNDTFLKNDFLAALNLGGSKQFTLAANFPITATTVEATLTFTITGSLAATNPVIAWSPAAALTAGLTIRYVRLSADNTVEVGYANRGASSTAAQTVNLYITVTPFVATT